MPELPEVEALRVSLEQADLRGVVTQGWRSRLALRTGAHYRPERVRTLMGATPGPLERRGKYILWRWNLGEDALGLLVHLGMSGAVLTLPSNIPREPHTHVVWRLSSGIDIRYVDPRRFGAVRVTSYADMFTCEPIASLGPEPMLANFNGAVLRARGSRSIRPIRDVLLDQHVVAGVGNIYALEALFTARIHPLRPATSLQPREWTALANALQAALAHAVSLGGTTFRNYRNARGDKGRNAERLQVYGRAGLPCMTCSALLTAFQQSGRGGVYCGHCQPVV